MCSTACGRCGMRDSIRPVRERRAELVGLLSSEDRRLLCYPIDANEWRQWTNACATWAPHGLPLWETTGEVPRCRAAPAAGGVGRTASMRPVCACNSTKRSPNSTAITRTSESGRTGSRSSARRHRRSRGDGSCMAITSTSRSSSSAVRFALPVFWAPSRTSPTRAGSPEFGRSTTTGTGLAVYRSLSAAQRMMPCCARRCAATTYPRT